MIGQWEIINNRFVYEYSDRGIVTVRFGNGVINTESSSGYSSDVQPFLDKIGDMASSSSLGSIPRLNTTMFFKYRVGGGVRSNVGVNTINSLGTITIFVNGVDQNRNLRVKNSLTVNNPLPALGGVDMPDVEELRSIVKYNFAAQERCVKLKDYYSRIAQMNGKFGAPYKNSVAKVNNKIEISIIGIDENGNLTNQSTSALKENVANYLSEYKDETHYVSVRDGRILNIGYEFDIFADTSVDRNQISSEIINVAYEFNQNLNLIMGQDIYLSQLIESVNNVGGVINVVAFRVYNKVGGQYSLNQISQPLLDTTTGQIDLIDKNAIFAEYNEIFEIKYKDKDIKVRFVNF
ncbi:MAG: hypothetical protein HC836_50460 [Richelia sp. RM2_1_2]|nr:hypothetical protein [Richelia sp. RM2_1_2]